MITGIFFFCFSRIRKSSDVEEPGEGQELPSLEPPPAVVAIIASAAQVEEALIEYAVQTSVEICPDEKAMTEEDIVERESSSSDHELSPGNGSPTKGKSSDVEEPGEGQEPPSLEPPPAAVATIAAAAQVEEAFGGCASPPPALQSLEETCPDEKAMTEEDIVERESSSSDHELSPGNGSPTKGKSSDVEEPGEGQEPPSLEPPPAAVATIAAAAQVEEAFGGCASPPPALQSLEETCPDEKAMKEEDIVERESSFSDHELSPGNGSPTKGKSSDVQDPGEGQEPPSLEPPPAAVAMIAAAAQMEEAHGGCASPPSVVQTSVETCPDEKAMIEEDIVERESSSSDHELSPGNGSLTKGKSSAVKNPGEGQEPPSLEPPPAAVATIAAAAQVEEALGGCASPPPAVQTSVETCPDEKAMTEEDIVERESSSSDHELSPGNGSPTKGKSTDVEKPGEGQEPSSLMPPSAPPNAAFPTKNDLWYTVPLCTTDKKDVASDLYHHKREDIMGTKTSLSERAETLVFDLVRVSGCGSVSAEFQFKVGLTLVRFAETSRLACRLARETMERWIIRLQREGQSGRKLKDLSRFIKRFPSVFESPSDLDQEDFPMEDLSSDEENEDHPLPVPVVAPVPEEPQVVALPSPAPMSAPVFEEPRVVSLPSPMSAQQNNGAVFEDMEEDDTSVPQSSPPHALPVRQAAPLLPSPRKRRAAPTPLQLVEEQDVEVNPKRAILAGCGSENQCSPPHAPPVGQAIVLAPPPLRVSRKRSAPFSQLQLVEEQDVEVNPKRAILAGCGSENQCSPPHARPVGQAIVLAPPPLRVSRKRSAPFSQGVEVSPKRARLAGCGSENQCSPPQASPVGQAIVLAAPPLRVSRKRSAPFSQDVEVSPKKARLAGCGIENHMHVQQGPPPGSVQIF
ncbi:uncharacterized protein [Paramisgurnus dabryanus]|uniref:uncharacterized protein n=1 Tax=Paramisgurnus dabryanus TaxID=90735 RepID=UPI003CCF9031